MFNSKIFYLGQIQMRINGLASQE